LQWMQGQLMHATNGIPNGKALLSPLVALVAKHHHNQRAHVQLDQATTQSLWDWQAILKTSTANPTLCSDLVPAPPDYTGYCDASKMGAGGVWFGANKQLPAIVWRISFPDDIQEQICSDSNPLGTWKWQVSCANGLYWNVWQTSNTAMRQSVVTIHPPWHGHRDCCPPRQKQQPTCSGHWQ